MRDWRGFVTRHERMIWLAAVLVLIPLSRVVSERVMRLRAGGLTAVRDRRPMAALRLLEARGGMWRLEEHKGQVVVVNVWATWCGPCARETPELVKAAGELAGENVAVVGLSVDAGGLTDGNRAKVREFARHYKVPYALGFPEAGSMIAMQDQTIPTTVLVDREGRVAKTYVGALTAGVLEEDVRAVAQGR